MLWGDCEDVGGRRSRHGDLAGGGTFRVSPIFERGLVLGEDFGRIRYRRYEFDVLEEHGVA